MSFLGGKIASWGTKFVRHFLGGVKRSGRHHNVMRFCFRNRFELKAPPKTNECPLKRDYFSREYIFQPLISRDMLVFQRVAPIFTGGNGRQCHAQGTTGKRKKTLQGRRAVEGYPSLFKSFIL